MSTAPQFYGAMCFDGYIEYAYNTVDDLKSVRRWLFRQLSPNAAPDGTPDLDKGDVWMFVVPDLTGDPAAGEGKFARPAVTIQLLDTGLDENSAGAAAANYGVLHTLEITALGRNRPETLDIAQRLEEAFMIGGRRGHVNRVPLWSFDLRVRLARFARVLPTSFAMGMDDADDQQLWSRPLSLRVSAPRQRPVAHRPLLRQVFTSYESE